MDGVDEQSANELIRRDPNNALGYYFLASRLYGPGKEKEMLAAFRKGAACPELRLYGESISNVLFKALDALGLKGRERLCASSWMATRWGNFEIGNLQAQATLLRRLAKHADLATQNEISDMMLMLAGQVIASDMQYHERFGNDALRQAFRLKAQIAAGEKSPMMNGYVGVVQALVSTRPDGSGLKRDDPRALALHIPGSIWYAFEVIDPKIARDYFPEMRGHVGADQAFEDAYQNWAKTSEALIEAALPDSDEIIGAYFHGHVPLPSDAPGPWVTSHTYVERLMSKKPDLLKAAAAYNAARQVLGAVVHAEQAAPKQAEPPSRDPVTAAKNECAENLRRIDSVKQQWALEMGRQATDVPIWEDLRPYLAPPTCPSGGIYTLGTVGEKPKCSIAGHLCP